ncbi:MAG: FAD-binding oxidoreductase [Candidatus Saccharimonadales bacterium]
MSKVAHYLQEHLLGEVMTGADARKYFATDGSIFSILPAMAVYPRNENDLRKTARFTWQLAERGRVIPMTARGGGSDQSGAALGSGLILAMPAHLNRIIELDPKTGRVVVEPGISYGKLQQTLLTHGRFLPPAPASLEYSTIGGAVANNASGEKSFKYGDTRQFVAGLKLVLANGELIETGRLNKRELNKKLGLATFEGEIYRGLDGLIEEQQANIAKLTSEVTKNASGYDLAEIKTKAGFDLTPLFVGAQGTLGIISQITLDTLPHNPSTTLMAGMFDDIAKAQQAIIELRALANIPASLEMVDQPLLEMVAKLNPNQLQEVITKPYPKVILLIEFDDAEPRTQKRAAKKAAKILSQYAASCQMAGSDEQKIQLQKLRQAPATLLAHSEGSLRALPAIEDGVVPPEKFADFLLGLYALLKKHNLTLAVWGHAGDGNLHAQPYLDIGQLGDRQKLFKLMDEYYALLASLGGSASGEHGDGRLRGAYLDKFFAPEIIDLFQKIKTIFDPYATLNPGVKTGLTPADIKPLLRSDFSLGPWYDHMPRS